MNPQGMPDPATQYAQLKSAVLGAQQAGGASPLGNFPELQQLYGNAASLDAKSQPVAGQAYNAQVEAANAQAAAKAEAQAKLQAEKDMLDPSKYQKIPLSDGGFKFMAPNGQEMSANDYSKITGQSLDKILGESKNPIDIGFQQDYKNLNDYINNKLASAKDPNSDAAKRAKAVEDKVQQDYGIDLHKAQISDVLSAFQAAYPTVFGGTNRGVETGSTFIPNSDFANANMNAGFGGIGG